jgi:GT2 family glycosyltransferase
MMSRRHRAAARPGAPTRPQRPVEIVQVDVDAPPERLGSSVTSESRVWIEAVRGGRVLGVVEGVAGDHPPVAAIEAFALADDAIGPSPTDTVDDASLARCTVVVPTICKVPSELVRTVNSLLAMDHPDFDVVVVDNRTNRAPSALPDLPGGDRVRVVVETTPGISSARNRGVSVATGEIVAFTDDDAVADPRWLRALGARLAVDHEVEAVGGLVLPLSFESAPQLWFEEFYGGFSRSFTPTSVSVATNDVDPLFPYAPGRFGAGCNMAFRRDALVRAGGFDVALGVGTPSRGGEDLAMFLRLLLDGGTVAFEPAAIVRHSHRATDEEFFRQVRGYGTGLAAMYTALVVHDPRHVVEIARRVPAGLRLLTRPREDRSPSSAPSYPKKTLAIQVLGMAYGPVAYARSVAATRRP